MVVSGAVVVVPKIAASGPPAASPRSTRSRTSCSAQNIDGAINFLLLGLDQRNGEEAEDRIRADSIIIVHIPATHDRVFMISLPRDAEVAIPDYPKTNFTGYRDKINAAFAVRRGDARRAPRPEPGRPGPGRRADHKTISNLVPGGLTFNGVAIINFDGFQAVLEAIGGVYMCVDEDVWSIHYPDNGTAGLRRPARGPGSHERGKHYTKGDAGTCWPGRPWTTPGSATTWPTDGDYGRQRHQQQLIKAIVKKVASRDTLTNFGTITKLQKAAGDLLTIDLGNTKIEDWVLTLPVAARRRHGDGQDQRREVRPNGNGSNEKLCRTAIDLLKAVQTDTVFDFLTTHQDWIADATSSADARSVVGPIRSTRTRTSNLTVRCGCGVTRQAGTRAFGRGSAPRFCGMSAPAPRAATAAGHPRRARRRRRCGGSCSRPGWRCCCWSAVAVAAGGSDRAPVRPRGVPGDPAEPGARAQTPPAAAHAPVAGPLNFLLLGSDYRAEDPGEGQRSDTIIVAHVTRDDGPRLPGLDPAGPAGATSRPCRRSTSRATTRRSTPRSSSATAGVGGSQLVSATLTDADRRPVRRRGRDRLRRAAAGGRSARRGHHVRGHPGRLHPHQPRRSSRAASVMSSADVLDYLRQRDFPDGDFTRQRHQQQFLKARPRRGAQRRAR